MHETSLVGNLIRRALRFAWLLGVVAILFFNLRLYTSSPLASRKDEAPPTLVAQLAAHRAALEAGSPAEMQRLFPEGYYFSYLFHGLTWIELAMRDESHASQAITEADECLSKLNSPAGRAPFPPHLPPDHGMFYSAWKLLLRSGIVVLQHGRDEVKVRELRRECDVVAKAINDSETPFLASYDGLAWPCDTIPAIHALATFDRVTGENRYQDVIAEWLKAVRSRLDPATGLIPHTASLPDGRENGEARATSQVILLRYLPDVDAAFAKVQYELFRERFLTTFIGIPCLLEYPSGISGSGDVDSGPLIFGRSPSATVLMMGLAQIYHDQSSADAIARTGEAIAMPWTSQGRKWYVGGILPIGEIIAAYSHVARPWFSDREHYPDAEYPVSRFWRWKVHALSLIVFLPIFGRFFRRHGVAPSADLPAA